jgi:ribose 5-phosphate isomerase B
MAKIAIGSDLKNELTDALEKWLSERGHTVERFGALAPPDDDAWTSVARNVGKAVASGACERGIVCCWTGTGASIAANKVRGVRAALCFDAATAEGARTWNDANVLALSLRATSVAVGEEILEAFLAGEPTTDPRYRAMIDDLAAGG